MLILAALLVSCCGPCAVMRAGYGRWLLLAAPAGMGVLLIGLAELRRDEHRKRSGLCRNCGYDLRATPNRCPECGTENPDYDPDA